MTSDFEKVTAAKTGENEKYIQPPSGTKEIEQHLRKNHRLEYGLAQVRYLFDPDFFRRDAIDFQKLVQSFSQKYEPEFQMPEMVKIAVHQQAKDPGAATPTPNDRLKEALLSPEGLVFLDGLLKYQDKGDDIERVIRIVNVHSQNLTVTVDGTTREAEFVGEKIACDLLESQQMKPQRDTFFRYVAGKQYSSTTTQRLGVPIDSIFSPAFRELIRKSIEDGVGWKAAVLPTPPKEKTREDFTVRCAFHRLQFKMSTFDKTSGDQDSSELVIYIDDRRWMGSDLISIRSRLSTDDHLFVVRELIRKLSSK